MSILRGVGISHKKANFEVREKIALNETESKDFLILLKDTLLVSEAMLVSTCNRTEIYYFSKENHNEVIIRLLCSRKGVSSFKVKAFFEKYHTTRQTVQHLLSVATGVESQVIGDMQIPNQVKKAYQWSVDLEMAGPFLHRLMHTVFYVNKRVAQETSFREGTASTSSASVSLIESVIGFKKESKILILGLGEMGRDIAMNLIEAGYTQLTLCNRTLERAAEFALEWQVNYIDFEDFDQGFAKADVVVSSIQVETPFITNERTRHLNPLVPKHVLDLSVPRSVNVSVPFVQVYNIDEIQARVNEAIQTRLSAVDQVNAIIDECQKEFSQWSTEMQASPSINQFKTALEVIRKEELSRYFKDLNEAERAAVEKVTASLVQKIIKAPAVKLRAACKRGEAEQLIDALSALFDLEKQKA